MLISRRQIGGDLSNTHRCWGGRRAVSTAVMSTHLTGWLLPLAGAAKRPPLGQGALPAGVVREVLS